MTAEQPPSSRDIRTRRRVLKPGLTAKNNTRQFVTHNYCDLSSANSHCVAQLAPTQTTDVYIGKLLKSKSHKIGISSPNDNKSQSPSSAACGLGSHAKLTTKINNDDGQKPKKTRKGPRGGVVTPFPEKLFAMLNRIQEDGHADVVSWQPHGRCFVVHRPEVFVASVMPMYFKQTKLTSFQRQLNLYGFARLTSGRDKGGYYHQLFLRGRPSLLKEMLRTKVKGTRIKAASSPDAEPDFYSMPFAYEINEEEQKVAESVAAATLNALTLPCGSTCNSRGSAVKPPLRTKIKERQRIEPSKTINSESVGSPHLSKSEVSIAGIGGRTLSAAAPTTNQKRQRQKSFQEVNRGTPSTGGVGVAAARLPPNWQKRQRQESVKKMKYVNQGSALSSDTKVAAAGSVGTQKSAAMDLQNLKRETQKISDKSYACYGCPITSPINFRVSKKLSSASKWQRNSPHDPSIMPPTCWTPPPFPNNVSASGAQPSLLPTMSYPSLSQVWQPVGREHSTPLSNNTSRNDTKEERPSMSGIQAKAPSACAVPLSLTPATSFPSLLQAGQPMGWGKNSRHSNASSHCETKGQGPDTIQAGEEGTFEGKLFHLLDSSWLLTESANVIKAGPYGAKEINGAAAAATSGREPNLTAVEKLELTPSFSGVALRRNSSTASLSCAPADLRNVISLEKEDFFAKAPLLESSFEPIGPPLLSCFDGGNAEVGNAIFKEENRDLEGILQEKMN